MHALEFVYRVPEACVGQQAMALPRKITSYSNTGEALQELIKRLLPASVRD